MADQPQNPIIQKLLALMSQWKDSAKRTQIIDKAKQLGYKSGIKPLSDSPATFNQRDFNVDLEQLQRSWPIQTMQKLDSFGGHLKKKYLDVMGQ